MKFKNYYLNLLGKLIKHPIIVKLGRIFFASSIVNDSNFYSALCLRMARNIHKDRPYGDLTLQIETTLYCNARCLMCTRDSMVIKKGLMEQQLFEKIIDDANKIGVKFINLSIYGEPLTDKNFLNRARYVDKNNINFSFFSNASLLTEEIAKSLLLLPHFASVHFSVNAYDVDVYEKVMRGLRRDAVYSNILKFLQLKQQLKSNVRVTITGVIFDETKQETNKLYKFWSSQPGVDLVYFPMIRNRGATMLDIEKDNVDKIEFSPLSKVGHKLHPCKYLWESLHIYWDGKVGVCCEDNAARRIIVGDLNNECLQEVWEGKNLYDLRRMHLEGRRKQHPICGGPCTYNTIWLKP